MNAWIKDVPLRQLIFGAGVIVALFAGVVIGYYHLVR